MLSKHETPNYTIYSFAMANAWNMLQPAATNAASFKNKIYRKIPYHLDLFYEEHQFRMFKHALRTNTSANMEIQYLERSVMEGYKAGDLSWGESGVLMRSILEKTENLTRGTLVPVRILVLPTNC